MTDGPASPPPAPSIEVFTLPNAFLMLLAAGLVTGARAPTLAPHVAPATGSCVYVVLAGVAPDDVRWGPQDVEGFWLATLDPGGGIADLQYLADMVVEPAGPPDHH